MDIARVRVLFLTAILMTPAACALAPVPRPPAAQLWSTPIYDGLVVDIEKAEGRPFDSIRAIVEDRVARAPVFPPATEKVRSDELFLLSPRNTRLRPSVWDRTFTWNLAEGGRDYILHAYSKDDEVLRRTMGNARRAAVSELDAPFVPGVVYSWDVSLCAGKCNLHLSSRAALRPTFTLMTPADEALAASDLAAVRAWCDEEGLAAREEATALAALALEASGLFMEEQQLLDRELKKRPGSILLHLVRSGALSAMNSPYGARDEYERARALAEKETGGAAGETPPTH
jgi:hypothetical protein